MKEFYKKNAGIIRLLLCFIIFYFAGYLILIPLDLLKIDYNSNETLYYIVLFSVNLLRAVLIFLLHFKDLKKEFKSFKSNFWEYSDVAVKYWLVGIAVMAVTNVLISLLTPSKMAVNETEVRSMISSAPIISLLLTTITAPVSEELIFRKSFRDVFHDKYKYIIISGVVFGAMHVVTSYSSLFDLLYIIPYSSLGIAFACICYKTKNTFPSMLVHAIHNGAITLVTIISVLNGIIL